VIRIAAALIVDSADRVLLVRKRGTTRFMQAGGKIEANESAADAVVRELQEEVGLRADRWALDHLGRFTALAANEDGHEVDAEVFFLAVDADAAPAAEIEEMVWVSCEEALKLSLAPLTRDILLPLLVARLALSDVAPRHRALS